jgi:hypothetical protein
MPNHTRAVLRAAVTVTSVAAAIASAGAATTRVNPLDNSLGSQVADFKPVSTAMVTGPLSDSRTVSELPLIGSTVKKLQAG